MGGRTDPNTLYYHKKLHMIVMLLVIVGSLNWLSVGLTGTDLVRSVLPLRYARWVYVAVGLAAVGLFFQRDTYLPFLGETLVPAAALAIKTPQNANDHIVITTVPGSKVMYWAAEPDPNQGGNVSTWDKAYGPYENSGVAVADERGKALLRFRGPPQSYTVPTAGRLDPHVHFRVAEDDGFMGRVQTFFLADQRIEGFADML
jgi:uncharacterized membrane protein YuzA (DUF378 family)